ncbi:hypothetical protein BIW11_09279, partial [Tropilaelaps mercedesae]
MFSCALGEGAVPVIMKHNDVVSPPSGHVRGRPWHVVKVFKDSGPRRTRPPNVKVQRRRIKIVNSRTHNEWMGSCDFVDMMVLGSSSGGDLPVSFSDGTVYKNALPEPTVFQAPAEPTDVQSNEQAFSDPVVLVEERTTPVSLNVRRRNTRVPSNGRSIDTSPCSNKKTTPVLETSPAGNALPFDWVSSTKAATPRCTENTSAAKISTAEVPTLASDADESWALIPEDSRLKPLADIPTGSVCMLARGGPASANNSGLPGPSSNHCAGQIATCRSTSFGDAEEIFRDNAQVPIGCGQVEMLVTCGDGASLSCEGGPFQSVVDSAMCQGQPFDVVDHSRRTPAAKRANIEWLKSVAPTRTEAAEPVETPRTANELVERNKPQSSDAKICSNTTLESENVNQKTRLSSACPSAQSRPVNLKLMEFEQCSERRHESAESSKDLRRAVIPRKTYQDLNEREQKFDDTQCRHAVPYSPEIGISGLFDQAELSTWTDTRRPESPAKLVAPLDHGMASPASQEQPSTLDMGVSHRPIKVTPTLGSYTVITTSVYSDRVASMRATTVRKPYADRPLPSSMVHGYFGPGQPASGHTASFQYGYSTPPGTSGILLHPRPLSRSLLRSPYSAFTCVVNSSSTTIVSPAAEMGPASESAPVESERCPVETSRFRSLTQTSGHFFTSSCATKAVSSYVSVTARSWSPNSDSAEDDRNTHRSMDSLGQAASVKPKSRWLLRSTSKSSDDHGVQDKTNVPSTYPSRAGEQRIMQSNEICPLSEIALQPHSGTEVDAMQTADLKAVTPRGSMDEELGKSETSKASPLENTSSYEHGIVRPSADVETGNVVSFSGLPRCTAKPDLQSAIDSPEIYSLESSQNELSETSMKLASRPILFTPKFTRQLASMELKMTPLAGRGQRTASEVDARLNSNLGDDRCPASDTSSQKYSRVLKRLSLWEALKHNEISPEDQLSSKTVQLDVQCAQSSLEPESHSVEHPVETDTGIETNCILTTANAKEDYVQTDKADHLHEVMSPDAPEEHLARWDISQRKTRRNISCTRTLRPRQVLEKQSVFLPAGEEAKEDVLKLLGGLWSPGENANPVESAIPKLVLSSNQSDSSENKEAIGPSSTEPTVQNAKSLRRLSPSAPQTPPPYIEDADFDRGPSMEKRRSLVENANTSADLNAEVLPSASLTHRSKAARRSKMGRKEQAVPHSKKTDLHNLTFSHRESLATDKVDVSSLPDSLKVEKASSAAGSPPERFSSIDLSPPSKRLCGLLSRSSSPSAHLTEPANAESKLTGNGEPSQASGVGTMDPRAGPEDITPVGKDVPSNDRTTIGKATTPPAEAKSTDNLPPGCHGHNTRSSWNRAPLRNEQTNNPGDNADVTAPSQTSQEPPNAGALTSTPSSETTSGDTSNTPEAKRQTRSRHKAKTIAEAGIGVVVSAPKGSVTASNSSGTVTEVLGSANPQTSGQSLPSNTSMSSKGDEIVNTAAMSSRSEEPRAETRVLPADASFRSPNHSRVKRRPRKRFQFSAGKQRQFCIRRQILRRQRALGEQSDEATKQSLVKSEDSSDNARLSELPAPVHDRDELGEVPQEVHKKEGRIDREVHFDETKISDELAEEESVSQQICGAAMDCDEAGHSADYINADD